MLYSDRTTARIRVRPARPGRTGFARRRGRPRGRRRRRRQPQRDSAETVAEQPECSGRVPVRGSKGEERYRGADDDCDGRHDGDQWGERGVGCHDLVSWVERLVRGPDTGMPGPSDTTAASTSDFFWIHLQAGAPFSTRREGSPSSRPLAGRKSRGSAAIHATTVAGAHPTEGRRLLVSSRGFSAAGTPSSLYL